MKGLYAEEKLMKIFWLRPAFKSRGWKWWRPLIKINNGSSSAAAGAASLLFLLLLITLLLFGNYVGYYSSKKAPQVYTQKTKSTLEFHLDCTAWNHTNSCPKSYGYPRSSLNPSANPSPESSCPEYFRWIHEDLKHWKQTGITEEMVEKARATANFRLTIVDGKVYVEKFRKSIQTRALFTMWGIVQMMRWHPGKLPDLDLMFDCDDRPVVQAKHFRKPGSKPPPLFRYCSDWRSLDIVFPDWSFWGWAETNIKPWRSVLKDIKEGNARTKWEDRVPYAYWKGNPHVSPWRADLMKCNVTSQSDWNTRLYVQDWIAESQKGYKESNIGDQCTHRYKIYIEGWSWSVSEKYILACNSPTLLMTLRWYDFFVRGMIPQHHFWPVRDNDKCRSLKFAVEWGNNHTEKAKAIGEAGSRYIHEDMKMEYVYDYMFHLLNEYAKLLKYEPTIPPNAVELCLESMACPADGIWRKFMEESLERSPSDSVPCRMPPPYDPQELKTFIAEKVKANKEVEAWENRYWDERKNEKHR